MDLLKIRPTLNKWCVELYFKQNDSLRVTWFVIRNDKKIVLICSVVRGFNVRAILQRVTLVIILGTYLEANAPYTGERDRYRRAQKDPRVLSCPKRGGGVRCDGEVGRVRKRNNKILRTLRPPFVHALPRGKPFS